MIEDKRFADDMTLFKVKLAVPIVAFRGMNFQFRHDLDSISEILTRIKIANSTRIDLRLSQTAYVRNAKAAIQNTGKLGVL